MENGRAPFAKRQNGESTVLTCVVFETHDAKHLLELLRQALTGIADPAPESPIAMPNTVPRSDCDAWLNHPEAAEYLGIATSTLYRYACQHRIESRKLAGRLEYRRSVLDKFKDLQIRPAERWSSPRGIIPAALGSGK